MSDTVLVTGGSGYIGSHCCKLLAERGITPVALDNLSGGHEWAVRWGPLVRADVRDAEALDEAFRRHRPSAVLHFAALIAAGESVQDPGRYYHNNVAGTLELMEAMRRHGCGRLVFSSTAAVYGEPEDQPVREDMPRAPCNPYGAGKAMVERAIEDYASAYGLEYAVLRYFNAAGADPDGELGEAHDPETHLVPLCILAALGRREDVRILGTDYPTPDGTCLRDYIHVTDLAEAHLLALEHMAAGKGSVTLNLGTSTAWSVRQVVDVVRRVSGRDFPVVEGPRRPGDMPELRADASLAREVLGWRPRYEAIEAIVETAWKWHAGRE